MTQKMRLFTPEDAAALLPKDAVVYNPSAKREERIPLDNHFPMKRTVLLPDEQLAYTLGYVWPTIHCMRQVIVSQDHAVTYTTAGFFGTGDRDPDHLGAGHVIFIGPPGTGKTLLGNVPRRLFNSTFGRLQGTADATPSDYTGIRFIDYDKNMMSEELEQTIEIIGEDKADIKNALRVIALALHSANPRQKFKYFKGPGHADIQLLDEVNRFAERVQSGFLENMSEGQITQFGDTYRTNSWIIGTMNPRESKGVVPLGHALLDRCMFTIISNPFKRGDRAEILRRTQHMQDIRLPKLGTMEEVKNARKYFHDNIGVSYRVQDLIDAILHRAAEPWVYPSLMEKLAKNPGTRMLTEKVFVGKEREGYVIKSVEGRGTTHFEGAARMMAVLNYRPHVTFDDVEKVMPYVCTHRIEYSSPVYQKYLRETGNVHVEEGKRKLIGHVLQAAFWDAKEEIERSGDS